MFTASDMTQCRDIMVIDPALGVEIARQSELHRLLKQHSSSMQPPNYDFGQSRRILDLACGPGDWVHDVAFADAELDVFGIDASPGVIQHARNMARAQRLENTGFQVMDLLAPLDLCDQDFDLINGRFLNACLPPEAWPPAGRMLAYWPTQEQMRAFFPLVEPFVLSMSGIDKALYERLYQQALAEWYAPDFYGVWIISTTWGRKPRA